MQTVQNEKNTSNHQFQNSKLELLKNKNSSASAAHGIATEQKHKAYCKTSGQA
jgi:hypothetical protein